MKKLNKKHMKNIRRSGRRFFITTLLIVFVMISCLSVTNVVSAGNKKEQTYKYYTSVQINPGDTLWSIANTYCSEANMNISNYIKLIKEINHLTSDNITSGEYITIMYYSSEYK